MQTLTIRSTILPSFMKRTLWRGTWLAATGALFLVTAGVFVPPDLLRQWGLLIFLVGMALITWGLLPYRRLKRLEEKPNTLVISEDGQLCFSSRERLVFSIPLESIERTNYVETKKYYGIEVFLKHSLQKSSLDNTHLNRFHQKSMNYHSCDLFFPFFSRRSWETLNSHL